MRMLPVLLIRDACLSAGFRGAERPPVREQPAVEPGAELPPQTLTTGLRTRPLLTRTSCLAHETRHAKLGLTLLLSLLSHGSIVLTAPSGGALSQGAGPDPEISQRRNRGGPVSPGQVRGRMESASTLSHPVAFPGLVPREASAVKVTPRGADAR
ncbi:hypothetical protein SKAU_G00310920 [Synaphobranchus kaupii]|uniref:Uncharacterized protein n=1 Tax=Synaphobranchus kaupii TaxID=118154 RepID=A0A9Q1ERM9_SYNKA|nr:hypothetical protein SKAU_G00310920 [Synaphobranchus kaupii]